MKFKDIKKQLGNGRILTIESSSMPENGDNYLSVLVREYDKENDFSDVNYPLLSGFVGNVQSDIVSAIKKALGCDVLFAYCDSISVEENRAVVISGKYGNAVDCDCFYLAAVPRSFDINSAKGKIIDGIKFYTID